MLFKNIKKENFKEDNELNKLIESMSGNIYYEPYIQIEIPQQIRYTKEREKYVNDNKEIKKLLIVDDNKLNVKVATKTLKDLPYLQIDECYDGLECLQKVKENKYDIILMDIMMPNMSGVEALNKLKEDTSFHTPVIALTADAVAGAKERYLSLGFQDYIAKPFTKEEIEEKIQILLKDI